MSAACSGWGFAGGDGFLVMKGGRNVMDGNALYVLALFKVDVQYSF